MVDLLILCFKCSLYSFFNSVLQKHLSIFYLWVLCVPLWFFSSLCATSSTYCAISEALCHIPWTLSDMLSFSKSIFSDTISAMYGNKPSLVCFLFYAFELSVILVPMFVHDVCIISTFLLLYISLMSLLRMCVFWLMSVCFLCALCSDVAIINKDFFIS